MKTGVQMIIAERKKQIKKHGRTLANDKAFNTKGQMATAARILGDRMLHNVNKDTLLCVCPEDWDKLIWLRMCQKSYKKRIIIAGALLAAEYDRVRNLKNF